MRPLAVLALVLAAALSLLFAFSSIWGGGEPDRARAVTPRADVAAVTPDANANADLAAVERIEETVRESVPADSVADLQDIGGYTNSLSGTVFDPGRTPVPNALVKVYREGSVEDFRMLTAVLNPGSAQQKATRTTRTDEFGNYEFQGLPPGNQAMLVVEHENFQRTEVQGLTIPFEGDVREDVHLVEGFRVFGMVTSHSTGRPIAGAVVVLDSPLAAQLPANRPSPDRLTATTDDTGRYDFYHVTPGGKWLTCRAEGFATQIKSDVMLQNGSGVDRHLSIDVRMHVGQKITGRVIGPDRQGVPGATLDAMSYNADSLSKGAAVCDDDGNFVIEGLAEAEYSVIARAQGFGEERKIRVSAGTEGLEIELKELGGVMGRVVDAKSGRALSNFKVSARLVNQTGTFVGRVAQQANVRDAKNGAFHLRGLAAGMYVVQASADGYADTRSDTFSVGQGLTVPDVVVQMSRGGTVTGVVINGYTNKPIAGAVVSTQENKWVDSPFTKALGGLVARSTTDAMAKTDKDGRFELELLTPGDYQINVKHPEFTSNQMNDVTVFEGQDKELGAIKVYTGSRLMGRVFNGDGTPCPGATVSLHPADGVMARNYETRTNSEGKYSLSNISPGTYQVSAARPAQEGNPFGVIVDMKNTERRLALIDQRDYTEDFNLGNSN